MTAPDGTRLVLVRHGRTQWNDGGRFQGQTDVELDETGRRQSAVAAPVLAAMRPDLLITSDLARAADTAAAVHAAGGPAPQPDARLREIDVGAWSGLTRPEIKAAFPAEYADWMGRQNGDQRRGGGETYREVATRAVAGLDDAVARTLVVIGDRPSLVMATSHGGAIRACVGTLLGLEHTDWWRMAVLGNCRWAVLVRAHEGWRLSAWNVGVEPA